MKFFLVFYTAMGLLSFVFLFADWLPRRWQAPFWVVVFAAALWPVSLAVLLRHFCRRE